MARKRLTAVRDFTFTTLTRQTRSVTAGEVFEVEPVEAAALVYQHKAMFTSTASAPQTVTLDPPRRRRYRRRDMQAEP